MEKNIHFMNGYNQIQITITYGSLCSSVDDGVIDNEQLEGSSFAFASIYKSCNLTNKYSQ